MTDKKDSGMSRRDMLRRASLAGAAVLLPTRSVSATEVMDKNAMAVPTAEQASPIQPFRIARGAPLHNLSVAEAEILDAMIARLIPSDENGPGAREAGALRYIDEALGGALAGSREAYRAGLAALDRYARYTRDAPFVDLSPDDQDRVLFDVQTGGATNAGPGFVGNSGTFFNMVRSHTWQGTFGDPSYGGNAEFIGWSLIGYPGLRIGVTADMQKRLEAGQLEPAYRSAYDFGMFNFESGEQ